MSAQHEMILILDFGSQYTQLIARRIREAHVYCEIVPCTADLSAYADRNVRGYVLSGGPASVLDEGTPRLEPSFFDGGLPILGICYGMHLIALHFGGKLVQSETREYGRAQLAPTDGSELLADLPRRDQGPWAAHAL